MGITRQNIFRGPGRLTLGSAAIDSKDGITLSQECVTGEVAADLCGFLGDIQVDQKLAAALTPYGDLSAALLAALYPAAFSTPAIGASLFGSADTACVIHSAAGVAVTLFAAALTRPPDLLLSAAATAFGPLEIGAVPANGKLPGEANALYKAETSAWSASRVLARPSTGAKYSAAFGSSTFSETVAGFRCEFPVSLDPVLSDNGGTLDMTVTGARAACRFQPLGLSEADLIALLGLNRARGSYVAPGDDLVITGTNGLVVTLYNCAVIQGPLAWGASALRAGELLFQANPAPTTGALYAVTYTPPSPPAP